MNQYNDTHNTPNAPKQRASVQNNNKIAARLSEIIQTIIAASFIMMVLAFITHCQPANAKNHLQSMAGMMDNRVLSNNHVSGKAKPQLLAFFVPENRLTSQVTDEPSATLLPHFTGVNCHILLATLPAVYDGVTLQNKRKPICRAVADVTESEPHHPMMFHSVVNTQKPTSGGYHA